MGVEGFNEIKKINLISEEERELKKVIGETKMGRNWDVTKAMGIETDPELFYRIIGDREEYDLIKDIEANGMITMKLEKESIFFNKGYAEQYFRKNSRGYIIETTADDPLEPVKNVKSSYRKIDRDLEMVYINRIWRVEVEIQRSLESHL